MPMADSRHPLSRVALQRTDYKTGNVIDTFNFTINPQNITEQTLSRTTYLNTKDWGQVQEFGLGQKTITLSGTTGWRRGAGIDDAWKLKKFLTDYQNTFPLDDSNNNEYLYFLNYTDDYQYWVTLAPNGMQFVQDVSQPLLVKYTINLIAIGDKSQASADEKNQTVVGKPGAGGLSDGNVRPNTKGGPVAGAIAKLKRDGR